MNTELAEALDALNQVTSPKAGYAEYRELEAARYADYNFKGRVNVRAVNSGSPYMKTFKISELTFTAQCRDCKGTWQEEDGEGLLNQTWDKTCKANCK